VKRSALVDVVVRSTVDVAVLRSSLRDNPFADLAIGVADDGVVAVAADGDVAVFVGGYVKCLAEEGVWRSVVRTLWAWRVERFGFGVLRRHGLPLWCDRHRVEPSPCGRLEPR